MKPNRKDRMKLKRLLRMVDDLETQYQTLHPDTKDALLNDFHGETELHLLCFNRNITDALKIIENGKV